MKTDFLFAITILLVAFALVSGASSSTSTNSDKQSSTLLVLQQDPKPSLVGCLPPELMSHIVHLIPVQTLLLVCHEWNDFVREHFAHRLKHWFEGEWFEAFFRSEKKRDTILSKIIAQDYSQMTKGLEMEAKGWNKPMPLQTFKAGMQTMLVQNKFIRMLPTMSTSDPKHRLLDLLSGIGNFVGVPMGVRQFIAVTMWDTRHSIDLQEIRWLPLIVSTKAKALKALNEKLKQDAKDFVKQQRVCSLSLFLSLFHERFDDFKESLAELDRWVIQKACIKIAVGIKCAKLSVDDRNRLFESIESMCPGSAPLKRCGFPYDDISASSISNIFTTEQSNYSSFSCYLQEELSYSPEHITANWYMKLLQRPHFPWWIHDKIEHHLLFKTLFLEKHQISLDEQQTLLEECDPERALDYFVHSDWTGFDTQTLVKWINTDIDASTISFFYAVILFSLDNDLNAFDKYSQSFKSEYWLDFAEIALGTRSKRLLSFEKRIVLLKHLNCHELADLVVRFNDDGDRKELLKGVMFLRKGRWANNIVCMLTDSDLSLLVELCLDCPEECCEILKFYGQKANLAARVLAKYVGKDTTKMASLLKLPEQYQAMVLLLTEHDNIANHLGKVLTDTNLKTYHSAIKFMDQEEAARAAQRMLSHRSPPTSNNTNASSTVVQHH